MKSLRMATSLAIVATFLAGCGAHGTTTLPNNGTFGTQSITSTSSSSAAVPDRSLWRAMYPTLPPTIDSADLNASTTIPFFSSSIKSPLDGHTYTYAIAGADPHTSKVITNLMYVPIVLVIKYPGGIVLDPTKPACGGTTAVRSLVYNGPNFRATPFTSNGVSVGTDQINDADQRAQFWSLVKGTDYHLKLKAVSAQTVIHVTAPTGSSIQTGECAGTGHDLGLIPQAAFDSMLQSLAKTHSTSTEMPIFLTYNTVETAGGGCCILGYHSTFVNGGEEVYATATFPDTGEFTGTSDIEPLTHVIGEAMNNPFDGNSTPAWGHIGTISGCLSILEVGLPLATTSFAHTYNGFTYHPQELAFFDWFFRTKSEGTGGKYSFNGTLATTQPLCT